MTRPRHRHPVLIVIADAHLIPVRANNRDPARGEPRHRRRRARHHRRNGHRVTRLLPSRAPQPAVLGLHIHRELTARGQLRELVTRPRHRHPILIVIADAHPIPIRATNRGPTRGEPRHRRRPSHTYHRRRNGQRVTRRRAAGTPASAVARLHLNLKRAASRQPREPMAGGRVRSQPSAAADAHLVRRRSRRRIPAQRETRRRRTRAHQIRRPSRRIRKRSLRVTGLLSAGAPTGVVARLHLNCKRPARSQPRELVAGGVLAQRRPPTVLVDGDTRPVLLGPCHRSPVRGERRRGFR